MTNKIKNEVLSYLNKFKDIIINGKLDQKDKDTALTIINQELQKLENDKEISKR